MNIFISLSVIFWSLFPSLISYTQGTEPPQKIKLTNLVSNGDFSNPVVSHWVSSYATLSIENCKLKAVGLGTGRWVNISRNIDLSIQTFSKFYLSVYQESEPSIVSREAYLRFHNSSNTQIEVLTSASTLLDGTHSYLFTSTNPSSVKLRSIEIESAYSSSADALNKINYLDNVVLINLTATFGDGNEPTKTYMDSLINDIGYFEGDYYYSSSLEDNYKWFSTGFVDKTGERDFLDYLGFFVWLAVPPISIYLLYKLMKGVIYE